MDKSRIIEAVNALKDGVFLPMENLNVSVQDDGSILVIGPSAYNYIENINSKIARRELENIKQQFVEMMHEVRELNEFVQGKSINIFGIF